MHCSTRLSDASQLPKSKTWVFYSLGTSFLHNTEKSLEFVTDKCYFIVHYYKTNVLVYIIVKTCNIYLNVGHYVYNNQNACHLIACIMGLG